MVKAVAVLLVISILAGILLGVVNHFTTVKYTVDISYETFDALYPAGAGKWETVKTAEEFDAEEIAANNFSYGRVRMYAINEDGTVILEASGNGGYSGGSCYAYTVIGTDGRIIKVKNNGSEPSQSFWDTNYISGNNASVFEARFEGLGIKEFTRIGVVGAKETYNTGANVTVSVTSGATRTSYAIANAVSVACRFADTLELVSAEDPNQPFADAINNIKALGVTSSEILGMTVAYTSADGTLKIISKTGYDVYISEPETGKYIILIFKTSNNKIESMGVYGYDAGTAIAAADVTLYTGIEMSATAAAGDPTALLGAVGTRTGVDLAAYKAVKVLAGAKGDPDIANKPNRDALKKYYDNATAFTTVDISDAAPAVLTLQDAEIVYVGKTAADAFGFIIDFKNGQSEAAALELGTVDNAYIASTNPFSLVIYVESGKIVSITAVTRDLTETTLIYGDDDGYALIEADFELFADYDLTGSTYDGPEDGHAVHSGSTISGSALVHAVILLQSFYATASEDPVLAGYNNKLKANYTGNPTFTTIDISSAVAATTLKQSEVIHAAESGDILAFIVTNTDQAYADISPAPASPEWETDLDKTYNLLIYVNKTTNRVVEIVVLNDDMTAAATVYIDESGYAPSESDISAFVTAIPALTGTPTIPGNDTVKSGSTISGSVFVDAIKLIQPLYVELKG